MHVPNHCSPVVKGNPQQAAAISKRLVWIEAIALSDETLHTKAFLRRLGDFMDWTGRGASMSYSQVARDCGMSERTAKYCAKRVRDRWLHVEKGKGHRHKRGRANLYHAMVPPSLAEQALANVARGARGAPLEHPQGVQGVHTYTYKTDNHLEGDTPPPNSRSPYAAGRSSNSNVIDFASLRWGGRS